MSTKNAFMNLTHSNFGLIRVQTLEKQIFGSSMIKLIVNQNKFESQTPNISLYTTTMISKIRYKRNPPILTFGRDD